MSDDSITVQFSRVLFKGKPEELQTIIALLFREAAQLVLWPHRRADLLRIQQDLQLALSTYYAVTCVYYTTHLVALPVTLTAPSPFAFSNN